MAQKILGKAADDSLLLKDFYGPQHTKHKTQRNSQKKRKIRTDKFMFMMVFFPDCTDCSTCLRPPFVAPTLWKGPNGMPRKGAGENTLKIA